MGTPTISRRSLLLAGAGAAAGAALGPAAALASRAAPSIGSIDLGRLGAAPRIVRLPAGVGVVGLESEGASALTDARLRVRLPGGGWGPWTSAASAAHGPEGAPPRAEPLWVGGARELELRGAAASPGARLRYVRAPDAGSSGPAAAAATALAQPVLPAGPGQPPIIARSAWARGTQLPRVAPAYGEVSLAFVHHTENPNGYAAADVPAMLRSIYVFHRDVNGWNDIGYNFVLDLFGRIWEARAGGIDEPVVGAHAGGYNLVSTGVAVLGSFTGTPISPAARRALERCSPGSSPCTAHRLRAGRWCASTPPGRRTANIRHARASRCRGSPGTATPTAPIARATRCTASCRSCAAPSRRCRASRSSRPSRCNRGAGVGRARAGAGRAPRLHRRKPSSRRRPRGRPRRRNRRRRPRPRRRAC